MRGSRREMDKEKEGGIERKRRVRRRERNGGRER